MGSQTWFRVWLRARRDAPNLRLHLEGLTGSQNFPALVLRLPVQVVRKPILQPDNCIVRGSLRTTTKTATTTPSKLLTTWAGQGLGSCGKVEEEEEEEAGGGGGRSSRSRDQAEDECCLDMFGSDGDDDDDGNDYGAEDEEEDRR